MEAALLGFTGLLIAIISLQKSAKEEKVSLYDLPLFWYVNGLFLALISILTMGITYQDFKNYKQIYQMEVSTVRLVATVCILFVAMYVYYRGLKAEKKRKEKKKERNNHFPA